MLSLSKKSNAVHALFAILEAFLLIAILFFSFGETVFCFLAVLVAFVHTALYFKQNENGFFVFIAMLFTLISDVFLVLFYTNTGEYLHQALGMSTFSITQIFYALYLHLSQKNKAKRVCFLIIRIAVILIVEIITLIVLKNNVNYLAVITMFYYSNLIVSTIFAFTFKKEKLVFALGLTLFVFCDLFIGASVAVGTFFSASEGSLLYVLANPPVNVAWLCYVPSQTLISLSITKK